MKNRLTFLLAVLIVSVTLCAFPVKADEDQFSFEILHHGVAFDHFDTTAAVESPPDPTLHPISHFEPSRINLSGGFNAGIDVNGFPVIVAPSSPESIPVANKNNQTEVLNQVRQVLIDSKLAVAPE